MDMDVCMYIYDTHLELRIRDYCFGSGKGAKPLDKEQGGRREGARGQGSAEVQHYGAVQGRSIRSLDWPPHVRL